ncbi:MAG TPA: class I adenylate-forming enzyme family protein [Thermoanaerobaculia bacterium]|jgi:acyl-CoA synthetase (AMP-forming)/AMP-acid ligase II|nr:class I adenylate-forming enzyme family protein [Thermoanaerobaculia bacterium]
MSASLSVWDAMDACLERFRGRMAVAGSGEALSYEELGRRIHEAACLLRPAGWEAEPRRRRGRASSHVGHVGHVGLCLANRPEYVVLYFAALAAGQLPLLLDANFNIGEIEAIRADCGLDFLATERAKAEALALPGMGEPIPCGEDVVLLPLSRDGEPAHAPRSSTEVCRFTSGTTGRPKCLEFSGHAVVSAARNWVLGTGMTGEDRTLCLAALSNGLAFNTSLLSTFLAGAEIHFLAGAPLTRPVARRIADSGITRLVAFPTLYRNFAAPGGPERALLAGLTHAISAGAPLWPAVREEFRALYGLDVSDYYGIAETGPCTFERDPEHHTGLGRPLPGVELRIAPRPEDEPGAGEVLVRTASMASGYLNHPGLFEARVDDEGFYHSGDRGRIVDGRLHLVDGTRDHINVAGRKIDPTEIVAVVSALDGVEDAVAFPDEDLNREALVHLVVVAARPEVTRATVAEACRARLAPYKVPGRISFVQEIPRTGIGKPRLASLREQLAAGNRG